MGLSPARAGQASGLEARAFGEKWAPCQPARDSAILDAQEPRSLVVLAGGGGTPRGALPSSAAVPAASGAQLSWGSQRVPEGSGGREFTLSLGLEGAGPGWILSGDKEEALGLGGWRVGGKRAPGLPCPVLVLSAVSLREPPTRDLRISFSSSCSLVSLSFGASLHLDFSPS